MRTLGAPTPPGRSRQGRTRVVINIRVEDTQKPSGVHRFWTGVIPEMAKRREHWRK